MATLSFSLNSSTGKYEAQFTSGDNNVVQIEFSSCTHQCKRLVEVYARVSSSMSWARIKSFQIPPDNFMFSIDIPESISILISTNESPSSAAILA